MAKFQGALGGLIPALIGVLVGVKIALDSYFVRAFSEGEKAAHGY